MIRAFTRLCKLVYPWKSGCEIPSIEGPLLSLVDWILLAYHLVKCLKCFACNAALRHLRHTAKFQVAWVSL